MPLPNVSRRAMAQGKMPPELVFRVPPSAGKIEIKRYLQAVYGLKVIKVHTANYLGRLMQMPWRATELTPVVSGNFRKTSSRKKSYADGMPRTTPRYVRLPDYKKVRVELETDFVDDVVEEEERPQVPGVPNPGGAIRRR